MIKFCRLLRMDRSSLWLTHTAGILSMDAMETDAAGRCERLPEHPPFTAPAGRLHLCITVMLVAIG